LGLFFVKWNVKMPINPVENNFIDAHAFLEQLHLDNPEPVEDIGWPHSKPTKAVFGKKSTKPPLEINTIAKEFRPWVEISSYDKYIEMVQEGRLCGFLNAMAEGGVEILRPNQGYTASSIVKWLKKNALMVHKTDTVYLAAFVRNTKAQIVQLWTGRSILEYGEVVQGPWVSISEASIAWCRITEGEVYV
jgi:hypothetical protein